jgi:hypothetical protein
MNDDPAAQIVTVVIDLITDKKHTHFVKAVDDLNPNSPATPLGMSLALTAPDYVVSERDGAWAMMLHGVFQSRGI